MKAMILAAGFGTRLSPYTNHTPKALFPIAGRPMLDITIENLLYADCREIIINTHHLYEEIELFVKNKKYPIPVHTRYEPVILGTGGAIKNVSDFWDESPFILINSDVVTDINLKEVYYFHLNHNNPATLVLHDRKEFNNVSVDQNGFIIKFHGKNEAEKINAFEILAFTGIQVIDPRVIRLIPENTFYSSIDLYRNLIAKGESVKAFIVKNHYWQDIGTPERYIDVVFGKMATKAFEIAHEVFSSNNKKINIKKNILQGDGSDRKWYRLEYGDKSIIMADHGIKKEKYKIDEVDSFILIGQHLYDRGVSVPKIFLHDNFSGLVFLEDLGNLNLQTVVKNEKDEKKILAWYKEIIDKLINLSILGFKGFNPSFTYQTDSYSKSLIIERECRYFTEAFLKGYLGFDIAFEDLSHDFEIIADNALCYAINGFMHRDMQSRNIMKTSKGFYFIDFQGGRTGPIQYDLASLLIDPYVELSENINNYLIEYCIEKLLLFIKFVPSEFKMGFQHCSITRNLQMLGAFGYLSRVKGKKYFEDYIPPAVKTLKLNFAKLKYNIHIPKLSSIVEKL